MTRLFPCREPIAHSQKVIKALLIATLLLGGCVSTGGIGETWPGTEMKAGNAPEYYVSKIRQYLNATAEDKLHIGKPDLSSCTVIFNDPYARLADNIPILDVRKTEVFRGWSVDVEYNGDDIFFWFRGEDLLGVSPAQLIRVHGSRACQDAMTWEH